MKHIILSSCFVLSSFFLYSQIQYLRYNDDFSYLDTVSKKGLEKLKYIPAAKTVKLSLGGEVREQLQWYNNINFGDGPSTYVKTTTWQLWHRIMAHANLDLSQKLRIFMQLSSTYRFLNPNPLVPEIDQNKLSVHQAFLDYSIGTRFMVRTGRQEISYGSHRLITFREGPNTRLTFDAAVFKYLNRKRKIDVFVICPVISRKAVFDDQHFKDVTLGFYGIEKLNKKLSVDYYFMHFHSKRRRYNFVTGTENRQVSGFRLSTANQKMNYEIEFTYQFGKFNQLAISAYGLSADLHYNIPGKKNIVFGFAGNYMTGDKNINDKKLNTYNLLYSKPQYGLTAPIGATNMITASPYIKISPVRNYNMYVSTTLMWRQSTQDGTYNPGAVQVRPTPEYQQRCSEKQLGTLVVMESNYTINPNLSLAVDASKFFAGNYVHKTGDGKDITYLSFKASFKF